MPVNTNQPLLNTLLLQFTKTKNPLLYLLLSTNKLFLNNTNNQFHNTKNRFTNNPNNKPFNNNTIRLHFNNKLPFNNKLLFNNNNKLPSNSNKLLFNNKLPSNNMLPFNKPPTNNLPQSLVLQFNNTLSKLCNNTKANQVNLDSTADNLLELLPINC